MGQKKINVFNGGLMVMLSSEFSFSKISFKVDLICFTTFEENERNVFINEKRVLRL